jgi:hypothetical protein
VAERDRIVDSHQTDICGSHVHHSDVYDLFSDSSIRWQNGINPKTKFDRWVQSLTASSNSRAFIHQYPSVSLLRVQPCCSIDIFEVHQYWRSIIVPAGERLVQGKTTPRYWQHLVRALENHQRRIEEEYASQPARGDGAIEVAVSSAGAADDGIFARYYLHRQELVAILMSASFEFRFFSRAECDSAIDVLISLGDIFPLDHGRLILKPDILPYLISEIVKPAEEPFNGLEMDNGCIELRQLFHAIKHQVYHSEHAHTFLPLVTTTEGCWNIIRMLRVLDVIVDFEGRDAVHAAPSPASVSSPIVSPLASMHLFELVPSRLSVRYLTLLLPSEVDLSSGLHFFFCRRLRYHDDAKRNPPGLMALLCCYLNALTSHHTRNDYSQLQVHVDFSSHSNGHICQTHGYFLMDPHFRYLDVLIWSDLPHQLVSTATKLLGSLEQVFAVLNKHGTGVQMTSEIDEAGSSMDSAASNLSESPSVFDGSLQSDSSGYRQHDLTSVKLCVYCAFSSKHYRNDLVPELIERQHIDSSTNLFRCPAVPSHVNTVSFLELPLLRREEAEGAQICLPSASGIASDSGSLPFIDLSELSAQQLREWFCKACLPGSLWLHRFFQHHSDFSSKRILHMGSLPRSELKKEIRLIQHDVQEFQIEILCTVIYKFNDHQQRFRNSLSRQDRMELLAQDKDNAVTLATLRTELAMMRACILNGFESESALMHASNPHADSTLLPHLFVIRPVEWANGWECLWNAKIGKRPFIVSFLCEFCMLQPMEGGAAVASAAVAAATPSSSSLRDSAIACDVSHGGYTIFLTTETSKRYLPWLIKGIRLLQLLLHAVPIVGNLAERVFHLSLPNRWIDGNEEHMKSIGEGLKKAMSVAESINSKTLAPPSDASFSNFSSCLLTKADAAVLAPEVHTSKERQQEKAAQPSDRIELGGLRLVSCGDGRQAWLCSDHRDLGRHFAFS